MRTCGSDAWVCLGCFTSNVSVSRYTCTVYNMNVYLKRVLSHCAYMIVPLLDIYVVCSCCVWARADLWCLANALLKLVYPCLVCLFLFLLALVISFTVFCKKPILALVWMAYLPRCSYSDLRWFLLYRHTWSAERGHRMLPWDTYLEALNKSTYGLTGNSKQMSEIRSMGKCDLLIDIFIYLNVVGYSCL